MIKIFTIKYNKNKLLDQHQIDVNVFSLKKKNNVINNEAITIIDISILFINNADIRYKKRYAYIK